MRSSASCMLGAEQIDLIRCLLPSCGFSCQLETASAKCGDECTKSFITDFLTFVFGVIKLDVSRRMW